MQGERLFAVERSRVPLSGITSNVDEDGEDSEDSDVHVRDCVISSFEPFWDQIETHDVLDYSMSRPPSIAALVEAQDDFCCTDPVPKHIKMKIANFGFHKKLSTALKRGKVVCSSGNRGDNMDVVIQESLSTKIRHRKLLRLSFWPSNSPRFYGRNHSVSPR